MRQLPVIPIVQTLPPPRICCGAVKRMQVANAPLGGTLIAWELFPTYVVKGPLHVFVDFGRTGTDVWEPINTYPIIDGCIALDPFPRQFAALPDYSYRLRLLQPENIDPATGHCTYCIGEPTPSGRVWAKDDWLQARRITRKHYLLQLRRTNKSDRGVLLKRRRWGEKCTRCLDWDVRQPKDPRCLVCWGTGFTGGYFSAMEFLITWGAPWNKAFKPDPQVNVRYDIAREGWSVGHPMLETDDVYVRLGSGERYILKEIETKAEIGGFPIMHGIKAMLAPATDIVYSVPLDNPTPIPEDGSSSSSQASCGPSTGLVGGGDW